MFNNFRSGPFGLIKNLSTRIVFLGSLTLCGVYGSAFADDAANWQKIQAADAKLKSVRLDWKFARTIAPHPVKESDEDYQLLGADLARQGMDAETVKAHIVALRASREKRAQGIKYSGEAKCLRVDNELRLDLLTAQVANGQAANSAAEKNYVVNYTDGKTGLLIDGKEEGAKFPLPTVGRVLNASEKKIFNIPDPAQRFFLFALPTTSLFPPGKATMTDGDQNTLILEVDENPESDVLVTVRATVSKATWRPTKIERFGKQGDEPLTIAEGSDFRVYGKDVTLPERIESRTPFAKESTSFALQKGVVGETIPEQEIKITYGPSITDCRFGQCVGYSLRSGNIPDEAKVKEMQSGTAPAFPNGAPGPGENIQMLAPPLFALFMVCLGFGILANESRRSGKRE